MSATIRASSQWPPQADSEGSCQPAVFLISTTGSDCASTIGEGRIAVRYAPLAGFMLVAVDWSGIRKLLRVWLLAIALARSVTAVTEHVLLFIVGNTVSCRLPCFLHSALAK